MRRRSIRRERNKSMNAKERSVGRMGLILSGALAVVATGCATHVHQRTVYVPAPAASASQPVVEAAPPAPQPPPPVIVVPPVAPTVVAIQSESDFYEPLNPYGRWVVVAGHGRCWVPARVETEWRPYANGYWQRTDAGWYWMSEEPWGWATYHYGRWDWNVQFGWFWVPQTQWAPAWVCWREGGGYVGWAPLRPSVAIGINLAAVNYEPAFASRAFVFVEHRHMMELVRPKTVVVNNTTIINKTVKITRVNVVNKTVINEGPRPEIIERESGRKIHSVAARDFRHREETAMAGSNRHLGGSRETARQAHVEAEVRTRPGQTPASRKEPSVARSVNVSTPVPASVSVEQTSPRPPMQNGLPNRNERKAETLPKARGQLPETKNKVEPTALRTIPDRPSPRGVEMATDQARNSARTPAGIRPVRHDAIEKGGPTESAVRQPAKVEPGHTTKSEVRRETEGPANRAMKPQLPDGAKPSVTSSPTASKRPQMSPRDKSNSAGRAEARADERAENRSKQER